MFFLKNHTQIGVEQLVPGLFLKIRTLAYPCVNISQDQQFYKVCFYCGSNSRHQSIFKLKCRPLTFTS